MAPGDDTKYIGNKNSRVDLDLPKTIRKQTLSSKYSSFVFFSLAVIKYKMVGLV